MINVEKLIEQLEAWNEQHLSVVCGNGHFACDYLCENEDCIVVRAATALSTLQAENAQLRGELEYEQEHANAYYEECGQWEVENAQLKEKLEALKQDRDAIEQDFRAFAKQWWEEDSGFPCRWCKSENSGNCEWKAKHPSEICAGGAFEWRGPQKEG